VQPGFILTYRGSDMGVIERIDVPSLATAPTLWVRGGISGSLRYTIPISAVSAVLPDTRRVILDDHVTFDPDTLGHDGEVRLIARTGPADRPGDWRPSNRVPRTSNGFRVYADDGYLGWIEATVGARADTADYLVVRARHWFRTFHPVLPTRFVVECEPLDGIVVVAGTRRVLRSFPELPPPAE
jgi:hypothetical protein